MTPDPTATPPAGASPDARATPPEGTSPAGGVGDIPPLPPELPDDEALPEGMSRRKLVALASATALLGLGLLLALVVVLGTQTRYGRGYIRNVVLDLTKGMRGRLYIGTIGGNLFTGVTIDSLELRDTDDSVFVATGPVTVTYDPRDFVDRRILLRHVRVERPVVNMRKDETGTWNWRKLFPSGPPRARRSERGFGDFIVVDSADVTDARFVLTMPWHPADSLGRGARRDSAIRVNLHDAPVCDSVRCWGEIRRDREGFKRTWRWTGITTSLSQARIKDPDSAAKLFVVERLVVKESDPPMALRDGRGTVRQLGDSVWIDFPRFALTSSSGWAKGKVVWGDRAERGTKVCEGVLAGVKYHWEQKDGCPVRYDITVRGERVAMNDINWVYPPLPTDGGGSMDLLIRTDPRDLRVIDYRLTRMDVRSRFSHIRGDMTFSVGGPVLVLKDVKADADPVDFRFLRYINQKPFPYPWAGTITGRIVARGGPVNRWKVDSARVTFRDANVPGAMAIGSGRGELDILFPAFTAFHGFRIDVDRLDLKTLQFLNKEFPRVNGYVQGSAILDSSWLDVRFRDAQVAHVDGPGEPTRATGSGRATIETKFVRYDLQLAFAPLNLTMLARSYAALPARGLLAGPMTVKGVSEDLAVTTDLTGPAGHFTFDGTLDTYPPGYAIKGGGRVEGLDLRRFLDDARAPEGTLTAAWSADVRGDTTTNLEGTARLDLERSQLAGVRLYGGLARLAFTPGHVRVDTVSVESSAATAVASGGLGLAPGRDDSLRFVVTVDSLGGLRRWLTFKAPGDAPTPSDTLAGSLQLRGTLSGGIDSLALAAGLAGDGLRIGTTDVRRLSGRATLADVARHPIGLVTVRADSVIVGRALVSYASLGADVHGMDRARFTGVLEERNGTRLRAVGEGGIVGDTARVRLDSLGAVAGEDSWSLDAPASLVRVPGLTTIEEVRLVGTQGGRVAFGGRVPDSAAVDVRFEASAVPLRTLGQLAQAPVAYGGRLWTSVRVEGTRDDPRIALTGALDSASFGGVALQRVTAAWNYAARRLTGQAALLRGGQAVLVASGTLPLDLSLRTVSRRLVDGVPLALNIRSEKVDLGLVESFSPTLQRASGTFEANVDVRGTWRTPELSGTAGITNGAVTLASLGVRLQRIGAALAFQRDSLVIQRVHAETQGEANGSLDVRGGVGFRDPDVPVFDIEIAAKDFAALRRARVADIDVSTIAGRPIRFTGSSKGSRLTGGVEVARADIYIPDVATKQIQALDDSTVASLVDTSLFTGRTLVPDAPSALVQNLRVENVSVRMGEDVWLRSSEANIKLGGEVSVTRGRDEQRQREQLALQGQLRADRGTYRLDLGLLQRTFNVEEGGTLTFYGGADLNPELNIRALYTVRQFDQARADVPIRVTIGGTLAQPSITLSSADNIVRSQSDLISYLITGQPNLEEAIANGEARNTALNLGFSTFGELLGSKISGLDVFQLQTGTGRFQGQQAAGTRQAFGDVLGNTRVMGGRQIGDRTFVSLSFGLCSAKQFLGVSSSRGTSLGDNLETIGSRVEYRLPGQFAVTASAEPSSSSLVCAANQARGALISPRQLGIDLSKRWEF